MKRILAGLALALLIAAPVNAKGGASITAADGPFVFGQSYPTSEVVASFEPRNGAQPDMGYWVRIDCFQAGAVVYAQFADLTPPIVQSGFTFGPTPSWSGGAASCQLRLATMNDGAIRYIATSDTFEALP